MADISEQINQGQEK
jgi:uncharacterized protein YcbK (DUF882 family)